MRRFATVEDGVREYTDQGFEVIHRDTDEVEMRDIEGYICYGATGCHYAKVWVRDGRVYGEMY